MWKQPLDIHFQKSVIRGKNFWSETSLTKGICRESEYWVVWWVLAGLMEQMCVVKTIYENSNKAARILQRLVFEKRVCGSGNNSGPTRTRIHFVNSIQSGKWKLGIFCQYMAAWRHFQSDIVPVKVAHIMRIQVLICAI